MSLLVNGAAGSLEVPRLLWPDADDAFRYPLADVGIALVEAVAKAGWIVPSLDVTFVDDGIGAERTRRVTSVRGTTPEGPFAARFSGYPTRVLDCVGFPLDGAGAEVRWYGDSSPTTLDLYVGGDYRSEGAPWLASSRLDERARGERRRTLSYETGSYGRGTFRNRDDGGRSYAALPDDPPPPGLDALVDRARSFLEGVVATLWRLPPQLTDDAAIRRSLASLTRPAAEPAPDGFPRLWTMASPRAASLLEDVDGNGHGYLVPSRRLVTLSMRVPAPAMHQGYAYATFDPARPRGHVMEGTPLDGVAVELDLRSLASVHVVDNSAFARARREARESAAAENPLRDHLTALEMERCTLAVALTMVPYASWVPGSFEDPVVVIGRELGHDEARVVRGRVKVDVVVEDGFPRVAVKTTGLDGVEVVHSETGCHPMSLRHVLAKLAEATDVVGSAPTLTEAATAWLARLDATDRASAGSGA